MSNQHWPAPDFDVLCKDHGDQMVLGNFNIYYPSWFSKIRNDEAAAIGEALDRAINSLQLAVANNHLPNHLSSQGQPS